MIGLWIFELDAVRDGIGIQLGLGKRDAGFKASEAAHAEGSSPGGGNQTDIGPHFISGTRESETGRHDADNGGWNAVEIEFAAEDLRVGTEGAAPPSFADDGYAGRIARILAGQESSAHYRLDSEHRKESGGYVGALDLFGIFCAGDIEQGLAVEFGTLERMIAFFPIQVVGDGERAMLGVLGREVVEDECHAVAGGIRQRTEKNTVDDAEDCRGGADSQGERENGDLA